MKKKIAWISFFVSASLSSVSYLRKGKAERKGKVVS
jgi:hypothetical protein